MFKKIIWATDGSEPSDKALPYVKSLAKESGASVTVLHVSEAFAGSRAAGLPVFVDEDEMKAKIERQVEELGSDGIEAEANVISGTGAHPAHAIAEAAREGGADLVVAGTRGHTALGGLLLGSVTQRLLHIAPCPVLAVPAGQAGSEGEPAGAAGAAERA